MASTPGSFQPRPLQDARDRPWGFVGLLGVILVAALALLVGPGLLTPGPSPEPSVAPSGDPHVVASSLGTFAIEYDYAAQAFVISQIVDATSTTELARQRLPPDQIPAQSGEPLFGTFEWAAACPGLTGGDPVRIVFGSMYPVGNTQYRGPAATWTIAPDGLFLVVLEPGRLDPGAELRMSTSSGSIGVQGAAFDYALNSGAGQSSGCFVA